jgi:hypothetical protein
MSQATESSPTAAAPPAIATVAAAPAAAGAGDGDACPNCGATLWGEFCFSCGQPRKGLIRRFTSILGDFLDTVFSIDNRIWRTLGPLLFLPGQLSLEYLAGRRVRYVTPFRLFFFLCILAFLALQWLTESSPGAVNFGEGAEMRVERADSIEAVERELARGLAEFEEVRDGIEGEREAAAETPDEAALLEASQRFAKNTERLRRKAEARKVFLAEVAKARAEGREPPVDPNTDDGPTIQFGNEPFDPEVNPVRIEWLPDAVNENLNQRLARAQEAVRHAREDPRPLIQAFFGAIPPVLFVLMPLFALVLKFFYLFKRRLYMEHLLVALHSHAFIFFTLLVIALLALARNALPQPEGWFAHGIDWLTFVLWWWIPIYLFVAQKRIYRQGWIMTTLKYGAIGITYTLLLSFGLAATILTGLLSL